LTGAAKKLQISQPAASQALSNLESRLGCLLFERATRQLIPTSQARVLNYKLDKLFEVLSEISKKNSTNGNVRNSLNIAASITFANHFLLPVIDSFQSLNPNLKISLEALNPATALTLVLQQKAQLVLMHGHAFISKSANVGFEPFVVSESCCFVPRGHALQNRDNITPSDLSGIPLVAVPRRHSFRIELERIFEQAGAELKVIAECGADYNIAEFISEGVAIGVVNSFPAKQAMEDRLIAIPFEPSIRRVSYFTFRTDQPLSLFARKFIDHAKTHVVETSHIKLAQDECDFFEDHFLL